MKVCFHLLLQFSSGYVVFDFCLVYNTNNVFLKVSIKKLKCSLYMLLNSEQCLYCGMCKSYLGRNTCYSLRSYANILAKRSCKLVVLLSFFFSQSKNVFRWCQCRFGKLTICYMWWASAGISSIGLRRKASQDSRYLKLHVFIFYLNVGCTRISGKPNCSS